jgi:hypothetical protein
LPSSLPRRSLVAMLTLALSMATLIALLAASPQALAQAHRAACPSSSSAHRASGAHACVQARRATGSTRRKAHGHSKVKGHHAKHSGAKKGKGKKKAKRRAKSQARGVTPAICENGSVPVNNGGGVFSCADESEPMCSNGSIPVLSSNGSALVCVVKASAGGPTEALCEDGSSPIRASDGSFSCEDESQPTCEDGATPAPSSDGSTLVCAPESSDDSGANEVTCENGGVAVESPDGSYSCVGGSEQGCEATVPTLSSEHWSTLCDTEGGA